MAIAQYRQTERTRWPGRFRRSRSSVLNTVAAGEEGIEALMPPGAPENEPEPLSVGPVGRTFDPDPRIVEEPAGVKLIPATSLVAGAKLDEPAGCADVERTLLSGAADTVPEPAKAVDVAAIAEAYF